MTVPDADLDRALAGLGDRVTATAPLAARTTYRVGGPARRLVEAASIADLAAVAAARAETGTAVAVIGRGSNLLVHDAGVDGVVVCPAGELAEIVVDDDGVVSAGAGVALPVLARRTVAAGWSGLEWAVGVPGSVGGAVRMNAGGHGRDTAADLVDVTIVDLDTGDTSVRPAADLDLGYRSSSLGPTEIVASARFRLVPGDTADGEATLADIVRWRREHQPGGANSGSVFANPDGDAAGRLIDECGGKGLRVGTAAVSTKHANFIQADPGGAAADVHAVVVAVRRLVAERTGVELRPELRWCGFDPAEVTAIGGVEVVVPAMEVQR